MDTNSARDLSDEQVNEALYAAACSLLERDRPRDAAAVLRLLLVRTPTDGRPWLALGWCHECNDDQDVAAWLYEKGIEVCDDPDDKLQRALDRVQAPHRRVS
jgi:Flp pilus assembly protein TadD